MCVQKNGSTVSIFPDTNNLSLSLSLSLSHPLFTSLSPPLSLV